MQAAFGALGWSPDEFWNATTFELHAGIEGWEKVNGTKESVEPMTREELAELMEKFPDGRT